MKPEAFEVNGTWVLTYPKSISGKPVPTELMRVSPGGQVIFNYKDWQVSTATDLFLRELSYQAPARCSADQVQKIENLEMRLKEANEHESELQEKIELLEKKVLADTSHKGEMGIALVIGAILGAVLLALIWER